MTLLFQKTALSSEITNQPMLSELPYGPCDHDQLCVAGALFAFFTSLWYLISTRKDRVPSTVSFQGTPYEELHGRLVTTPGQ